MVFGRRFLVVPAFLVALLPIASTNGPTAASATEVRQATGWSTPVNVSQNPLYDNAPAIAVSTRGGVTIAWERRPTSRDGSNSIHYATSSSPTGSFSQQQLSESASLKTSGSPRARRDGLDRRHVVWWQQEGTEVCNYYARIEADGRASVVEQVPGSCGLGLKNTALAVGPDNSVHALFGKNLSSVLYWSRADAGWVAKGEALSQVTTPRHLAIGVTTGGVVISVWRDAAGGGNDHLFAATRRGAGSWAVEDVTAGHEPGCSVGTMSYHPSLAADFTGGMRLAWSDQSCGPQSLDAPRRDMYYREWTPEAGWSAPPVKLGRASGDSYQSAITVDAGGAAHIAWVDNSGDTVSIYYARGRGSAFTAPATPFKEWARGAQTKDVALDYSPGYIHLAFGSDRDDPQKENYYSYLRVEATPATLPPSVPPAQPPPAVSPSVPGSTIRLFPETGKALNGLFLDYWAGHGGLAQQGYPISDVKSEVSELNGKPYTVQYTERAVFEYHPENKTPFDVLLSQLGTFRYRKKYAAGTPEQRPNMSAGSLLFPQTGKRVGGRFLHYWQANGGVQQQGYPISDEFTEKSEIDGKLYTVQYFERAVFEWHPENRAPYDVLLSLLGVLQYKEKYIGR